MTAPRRSVGIGICPKCSLVHLVVFEHGKIVDSIPLDRAEWAVLIGAYTQMQEQQDGRRVN